MTREIYIEGMTCGHCKMAVEKAVKSQEGVSVAAVDLPAKKLTVEYDGLEATLSRIIEAIEDTGYTVKKKAAS